MSATWDELVDGEGPPPRRVEPLTRTDFVQWVGALADFMSPLHYDDRFARDAGYRAVISPGMLQAGLLSDYAAEWLGAKNVRSFSVRFRGVVFPGDALICSGRTVRKHAQGDERRVDVELSCRREEDEEPIVTGEATFAVPG